MGATPKLRFSRDSQVGSPTILEIGIPSTLDAHNFLCKPLIVARSKTKLYSYLKSLQIYVARLLCACKLGKFLTFNGRNQIDTLTPSLSFGHNLCCKYSNR
jgi:hypothetical protein